MSTISTQFPPPPMPRLRMPDALSAQSTTSGVAATDATSSASTEAAESGPTGVGSGTDSASLDPSGIKDRIDSLLAQQVQNGTLTSAQADTLKSAFQTLGGGTEVGGVGQRPQGPPPGPPPGPSPDVTTGAATGTDTASASSASSTSSTLSTDDLMVSFVKQLQTSQNRTSAYGADGARSSGQTASALLLNFRA